MDRERRAEQALALRIAAVPYDEIAKKLGYASRQAAFEDVRWMFGRMTVPGRYEAMQAELLKLEKAERPLWAVLGRDKLAVRDRLATTGRLLDILKARADYLGLHSQPGEPPPSPPAGDESEATTKDALEAQIRAKLGAG